MTLEDYNGGTWICGTCGETVSFSGPATTASTVLAVPVHKALAISNHMYYSHERPSRMSDRIFIDSYDGAQLTEYDKRMLTGMQVRWNNKPVDNQRLSA